MNTSFHPLMMRIVSAALLTVCMALPLRAEARPSVRAIQTKGAELEKSGMQARIKNMQEGLKQKYELRKHPRENGMSIMVPKDWKLYLPSPSRDLDKFFAGDLAMYYLDQKEGMEILGFGLKVLDHPAMLKDADDLHTELAKQPSTDFEFLNKGFLHDYEFISAENITVSGMPARAHTYSYIWASVHWQETDIRIPNGNTMIVLFYQAPKKIFTSRKAILDTFVNSLTLSKDKVTATKSKSASSKKKKRIIQKKSRLP